MRSIRAYQQTKITLCLISKFLDFYRIHKTAKNFLQYISIKVFLKNVFCTNRTDTFLIPENVRLFS